MKFLMFISLMTSLSAFGSDHIDGPITTSHAVGDITDLYAYPSTEKPGYLTLIMNTYPFVPSNGHFADKVSYEIIIREAVAGLPIQTSKGIQISCTFETPYDHSKHFVNCKTSLGSKARVKVDEVDSMIAGSGMHVFAGHRSDPFFFNSDWSNSVSKKGKLVGPKSDNTIDKLNVLSIIIDLDVKAHFGSEYKLLAVVAQTITQDSPTAPKRRLDRVGRPEITNVSLIANDKEDLRDAYNLEAPFNLSSANAEKYRVRLSNNIKFYDRLDQKEEWHPGSQQSLVKILMDDYLVVDTSKKCGNDNFLEIERSILNGTTHKTCGGRRPTDDIMDVMYGLYIDGGSGKISDGINSPYRPVSKNFPYLAEGDKSISAKLKALLARKLAK